MDLYGKSVFSFDRVYVKVQLIETVMHPDSHRRLRRSIRLDYELPMTESPDFRGNDDDFRQNPNSSSGELEQINRKLDKILKALKIQ